VQGMTPHADRQPERKWPLSRGNEAGVRLETHPMRSATP
jgi:hypothetical protein